MSDYSSMSNAELKRVIAERLGWAQVTHNAMKWLGSTQGADLLGFPPEAAGEEAVYTRVPNWPESADAAIELFPYGFDIRIMRRRGQWLVGLGDTVYPTADTPARALCEAWLAWSDAQGGNAVE